MQPLDSARPSLVLLDWDSSNSQTMEEHETSPIVVPWVGLELGSRIKLRIGFELPVEVRKTETVSGLGLTTSGYATTQNM